jgi:hypothetical protein
MVEHFDNPASVDEARELGQYARTYDPPTRADLIRLLQGLLFELSLDNRQKAQRMILASGIPESDAQAAEPQWAGLGRTCARWRGFWMSIHASDHEPGNWWWHVEGAEVSHLSVDFDDEPCASPATARAKATEFVLRMLPAPPPCETCDDDSECTIEDGSMHPEICSRWVDWSEAESEREAP